MSTPRRIGRIGTTSRIVAGLALLLLALAEPPAGVIWNLALHELLLGLVAFPAAMVAIALVGCRLVKEPLRFTGRTGLAANCVVIIVLFSIPYTTGAAALFYGTSLLLAAWRGLPGCEATVLSNMVLRRDDQIGCPTFSPIDAMEARRGRGAARQQL